MTGDFEDVQFRWDATAPMRLTEVFITGKETRFSSTNPAVRGAAALIATINKAMGYNVELLLHPKT
jgi:hypothetical protein